MKHNTPTLRIQIVYYKKDNLKGGGHGPAHTKVARVLKAASRSSKNNVRVRLQNDGGAHRGSRQGSGPNHAGGKPRESNEATVHPGCRSEERSPVKRSREPSAHYIQ